MTDEIRAAEDDIKARITALNALRRNAKPIEVTNYTFETVQGSTTLLDLFGDKNTLLVIHNMGQACRYCTLWADGINGFVPHLESVMSLVLVSKDAPEAQRRFANSRGWRFRLASHGGGTYMAEQATTKDQRNMPGATVYERVGNKVFRKNTTEFCPDDIYCAMWSFLGMTSIEEWTPQFSYWLRPKRLDDGGANLLAD